MIRHLDLFAGIGGFALAVRWLGGQTTGFCEIDPWARRVLDKHWPEVPKHDDIRTLTGDLVRQWGGADLITGGFPCQPFSVAGQRRGTADDRHLWPEMARVIAEVRPRFVLGENVPGLVSVALDDVLADLESLDYTCRAVVVPACAVDAPHRRDRLWIVAHANGQGEPAQPVDDRAGRGQLGPRALAHATGVPEREPGDDGEAEHGQRHARLEPGRDGAGLAERPAEPALADADRAGREEQRRSLPVRAQHTAAECGGEDGWGHWLPEPRVGGVAARLSDRVDRHRARRLQGLGNAIVPQVAYELLRVMLDGAA